MESEGWEDRREEISQLSALHQSRNELKYRKHTCLHGDQFTITITLLTPPTLTVDHTHHIPEYQSRKKRERERENRDKKEEWRNGGMEGWRDTVE